MCQSSGARNFHFADGRQETFDLVVGADGAWSRIRPAVSSVTPHYTGVTSVETSLDDVDTRHPDLARLIGDGSVAAYGVNRSLVAQRNSGGHVKVYAMRHPGSPAPPASRSGPTGRREGRAAGHRVARRAKLTPDQLAALTEIGLHW